MGFPVKWRGESSNYWSSTTNANNNENAWNVNFNNGNVNNNNKNNNNYARAVRGRKCRLLSYAAVYQAYEDCRRRKRGTINAMKFEADLLDNLFDLALALQNGTWQPARSVCFVTTRPKTREIFAADFRDRVVHHLLVRRLEELWEPRFIYDSYASRKSKGIHVAAKRLQNYMLKATCSNRKPAWFIQLDISSFFMSIDKGILNDLFAGVLHRLNPEDKDSLLYLLGQVINHDCTIDYCLKGKRKDLALVPDHKSLFKIPAGKGLPIGNLTSQFFANVYLNELDQFVKHRLACRYYLRYVDDFILVDPCPERLTKWQDEIVLFIRDRLALKLKSRVRPRRVSQGADFLGYIIRPSYILVRRRVVNNLKNRLNDFGRKLVTARTINNHLVTCLKIQPEQYQEVEQVLSSYIGHFKHANNFNLTRSLFAKNNWLAELFGAIDGRLVNRFRCMGLWQSLKQQVSFFRVRLPRTLLLVRVGCFYEAYEEDALVLQENICLFLRQRVRGFSHIVGFPCRRLEGYIQLLLTAGFELAVIEQGHGCGKIKDRYLERLYRQ